MYVRGDLPARLIARVDRSCGPDACWPFNGAVDRKGYGAIQEGSGRVLKAHRVAYEIERGPIPDDLSVLHRCDTPICCNPAHLFLGTVADNNRDMWGKGRGRTGWESRRRNERGQFAAKGGVA